MSTAEKLKGQISFPCCPKEKAMAYVAKERVDGKLILPEAVQILKLKTE